MMPHMTKKKKSYVPQHETGSHMGTHQLCSKPPIKLEKYAQQFPQ